MARGVAFNQVATFERDPRIALPRLEENIRRKLRADDQAEFGPFTRTQVITSTYTARPWEIVLCDTRGGGFTVVLPDPGGALAIGSWIAVKTLSDFPGNNLQVAPITGTIDGATSWNNVTPRVFQWFFSTGDEWKQGPSHIQEAFPRNSTHRNDAGTLGLWQLDPPTNGGSGLVDSSGNGLTLAMGAGTERYSELGYGQEGALLDGANYWKRAGGVNDTSLNLVGDMTISMVILPLVQPAALGGMCLVNYGAVGETGGNDNVFFQVGLSNASAFGPNVAGMVATDFFWETGAGTNHTIEDYKLFPLGRPTHISWVRSDAGATLRCYINGFRQSLNTGLATGTVGGAPAQCLRIGNDHNVGLPYTGVINSVKITNRARTDAECYSEAARCLGFLSRGVV